MNKSTIIGCFLSVLTLSLSAQTSRPSTKHIKSNSSSIEATKTATTSVDELLKRRNNIGIQMGPVSEHFSIEEQKILRSYLSNQQQTTNNKTVIPEAFQNGNTENFGVPSSLESLSTVYGVDNSSTNLIGFEPTTPDNVEVFGSSPIVFNFEDAGAIDPQNPTTGYVIDDWGEFYSFDVESGFYTHLGNIPGWWLDMEYDRNTGILYAISEGKLYTIDPIAVTATEVGALVGIPAENFPATLAIDGNGVGYTFEMVDKGFYAIDLATATTTYIGNIDYNANYSQGMTYDPITDMVYISAFNDDIFTAEWRTVDVSTGMTTLIGPIVTPSEVTQVAWVSFGETLAPPTCERPTDLAVSNIMTSSVDLSWVEEPNASNGYIWYVFERGENPVSGTPIATGTTPSGITTATATDLANGLAFDFYVRADCDSDGVSQLAGPIKFSTVPTCGGKFYDSGGPNYNYSDNENITTVIHPETSEEAVTVTFINFDVEDEFDALYVYDGPDTSYPMIASGNPATYSGFPAGGYYGVENPGPFTSTHSSGALTFVFLSSDLGIYPGWEADVTCTSLGINEHSNQELSFYPNPTDGILNFKSIDNIENVTIFNVLGQQLISHSINATNSQVDLSELSTGTYIMKVLIKGQLSTHKVLKN
ncbi:T9SS type A sorting domain-containing protein [Aequorivita xiaoshiensis]|uniref:T9SS type A sorting domain-containing protein n=1 Tax=Aequorivita xiaoshiensis TaxID=2874476 RepID=A0A9X1U541_9FLAO|nr:T9SS type A sorting domain-containing protein [Aequorivita xiaoshiensis]MCG2429792.1 T9SS type A sorting domain-containing protein [Aequorivita xiaoshiensis]